MKFGAASPDLRQRYAGRLQRVWRERGAASDALLPLAWLFGGATLARRWLYRRGVLVTHALPVPVIVVGNLLVGGAGKTPAVIAIAALLRAQGWTPGIVSRGYGRERESEVLEVDAATDARRAGDEPLVLARRTGAPVVVGRDRVAAGHALLQSHPDVDVLLSDDGLQHLGLGRDVEIVVFDERGAGNGRLLPAGPLREPMPDGGTSGVTTSGRIVLYNAEAPTTALPGFLGRRSLAGILSLADWWRGAAASADALESLRSRSVVAAAGLARPERFFAMLRQSGLTISELALADHFDFASLPWPIGTSDVVVTEKDAVKLTPDRRIGARVWVAALDFDPETGFADALLSRLSRPLARPPSESHGNTPA
jgi:tetraacyldisaccharide 4'-kinase